MKRLIFKLSLFSLFTFSTFTAFGAFIKKDEKLKADVDFFKVVKDVVSENYVEEVNSEDFIYSSLDGGISGLDPHSGYIAPKDYNKFKESLNGEFSGLGVQITTEAGFIKVISPIDDTPAFKAGIKAGDFITHIDGENTYQMLLEEASSKMRGKEGTKIKLTIVRTGTSKPIELEIKREKIKNKSVTVKVFNEIAIIRIASFTPTTATELKNELTKVEKIKGIVLDLRNNPGGVLEQSIIASNFFLNQDQRIVSVKSRKKAGDKQEAEKTIVKMGCSKGSEEECINITAEQKENETIFYSNGEFLVSQNIPIITIINKGSASASEILAGALKENKRAITIGEISFGKGVVQTILPIMNGEMGALKLTTSRYYSPKGNAIQTAGITPDVIVISGVIEASENKLQSLFPEREKDLKNHTAGEKLEDVAKQSEKYAKSKEQLQNYYKDLQLLTAINIIEGINSTK